MPVWCPPLSTPRCDPQHAVRGITPETGRRRRPRQHLDGGYVLGIEIIEPIWLRSVEQEIVYGGLGQRFHADTVHVYQRRVAKQGARDAPDQKA